jgi:uncharacterized repeat protein (TIGR01451 family)
MSRALKGLALLGAMSLFLLLGATAAFGQGDQTSAADATALAVRANIFGNTLVPEQKFFGVSVPKVGAETPDDQKAAFVDYSSDPLITELSALKARATRTATSGHAEAHTGHAFLLNNSGTDVIKVDALHATSDSACQSGNVVSNGGANIVGLYLNGQGQDIAVAPNTEIPLTMPDNSAGIRVILNEQVRDADGHGLTVTALHVLVYETSGNLIFADIRIAQAHSTAFCVDESNGGGEGGSTESPSAVTISKRVASTTSDTNGDSDGAVATAFPGDNVTWTITFTNKSDQINCSLFRLTDVLPTHFSFVSSSGDLTTVVAPSHDGQNVTWDNPAGYKLMPGTTLSETLVAKIADDTPEGTYTNLLNVENSSCSAFSSGEVGPVKVIARPAAAVKGKKVSKALPATEVRGGTLPRTGLEDVRALIVGVMLLVGSGLGVRMVKQAR